MTHARQQIRDAAVTLLTGLATTGANVFPSRTLAVPADKRPALLVYTTEEESEPLTMGADPALERLAVLMVVGLADAAADPSTGSGQNIEDLLDDIAGEVETAFGADPQLGGLVKDLFLSETSKGLTGEGEQEQGMIRMTFDVEYHTKRSDPDTVV